MGSTPFMTRDMQRAIKEQEIAQKKISKAARQASEDRTSRDIRYAKTGTNEIMENLLSAASYLAANSQGDTTLSQESLLNLGGKLG